MASTHASVSLLQGLYSVAWRWIGDLGLQSEVNFEVFHEDGSTLLTVNQQNGGNAWVDMGLYCFDPENENANRMVRTNGEMEEILFAKVGNLQN